MLNILDAKYKKADLPRVVSTCTHISNADQKHLLNLLVKQLFVDNITEDDIVPPTIAQIAKEQQHNPVPKDWFKPPTAKMKSAVVGNVEVLMKNTKLLVIPQSLQNHNIPWKHHYLQYSGHA